MEAVSEGNVRFREEERRDETARSAVPDIVCPQCGRGVAPDDEICPHCGAKLTSDCSFCGAHLLPGERECPECGMPAGGITCPQCGTHNYRTFCRICNAPLTKAAARAVERAKADPVFQQCEALAAEVEALQGVIEAARPSSAEMEALKEEQKKKICSLNEKLRSMIPPPGSTPKEQMMFYSARKVAVTTSYVTRVRTGWLCNYCGCTHDKPIECTKPELGGHWIYEERKLTFTEYK